VIFHLRVRRTVAAIFGTSTPEEVAKDLQEQWVQDWKMLLLVLSNAAAAPVPVRPAVNSTATVRIERPAVASREQWERLPKESRRELVVRGGDGRLLLVRVIEYQ
jgi:hypothetical protein